MRLALALGAAVAALTVAAAAADSGGATRVIVRHGPELQIDADRDGWITRAEAAAAADRMFARLDRNDDGRLTDADRPSMPDFDIRVNAPDIDIPDIEIEDLEVEDLEGGGERRVQVIRRGADSERIEREVARALERAEREIERAERQAERAEREAERAHRLAEREVRRLVDREVIVIGGGHGHWVRPAPGAAPVPPVPPHPPMFMMMVASSEEADLDGDGALSREEFRAQQLRFFDASDANGDGRIRFEPPPEPPAPPAPPEPRH
jgi:hypothetical protein